MTDNIESNIAKVWKILIDKAKLVTLLLSSARLLQEKSGELSELDARFGDGDHGVTIKKIADKIEEHCIQCDETDLNAFLATLGDGLMGISGGAAAPLWGTFIGGLALPIPEAATEIDPSLLKKMFSSALEEMQSITNAKVGDKTLMDTLIPAVESAQAAEASTSKILEAASRAASEGARATENFQARFGRAKNYKERSLGTPDPGAVSLALFFEGLAAGLDKN